MSSAASPTGTAGCGSARWCAMTRWRQSEMIRRACRCWRTRPKPSAITPSASAARSAAAWRMPILRRNCRLLALALDAEMEIRSARGSRMVPRRFLPVDLHDDPGAGRADGRDLCAAFERRRKAGAFVCSTGGRAISPSSRSRRRSRAEQMDAVRACGWRSAASARCRSAPSNWWPAISSSRCEAAVEGLVRARRRRGRRRRRDRGQRADPGGVSPRACRAR